jgi:hypothetical protein
MQNVQAQIAVQDIKINYNHTSSKGRKKIFCIAA